MITILERHILTALLILDLEDAFVRSRSRPGDHPRPLEPLRFFLVQKDINGTVTTFDPPIELEVIRNSSGYHLFFGRQKVYAAHGKTSTASLVLPQGKYTLRVTSPFYQTVERKFHLPIGNANDPNIFNNYHLDLEASFAYPFPDVLPLGQVAVGSCTETVFTPQHGPTLLRGVLLDAGGNGLSGARVRVINKTNIYTTDSTGQWVLWFKDTQPTGPVELNVEIPTQPVQLVNNVCVVQGRETSLQQTALRGWVRQGSRPLPGAVVTVQTFPGQAVTGRNGGWIFTFPFSQGAQTVTVIAQVPGRPAQNRTVNLVPRASIVLDPFQF